jgi:hypothetical protein
LRDKGFEPLFEHHLVPGRDLYAFALTGKFNAFHHGTNTFLVGLIILTRRSGASHSVDRCLQYRGANGLSGNDDLPTADEFTQREDTDVTLHGPELLLPPQPAIDTVSARSVSMPTSRKFMTRGLTENRNREQRLFT